MLDANIPARRLYLEKTTPLNPPLHTISSAAGKASERGNRYRDVTARHLQRAIDELGQWFRLWRIEVNPEKSAALQHLAASVRTVMTYASPVFAHAASKALHKLQASIQSNREVRCGMREAQVCPNYLYCDNDSDFSECTTRDLSATLQGEKINQALNTEYHQGNLPTTLQGEKINQALNTDEPQDVNSLTRIDSGSRMSPTVCKLTHRNRFWLEEEPHRM
ncbi:hypothetical protein EVAR_60655_1 [Eumeta japonica]|uniref:Uncharacterized protein n=1 Tax=Eumeta variegata TaxID=151549 RepID=A0A4C1ZPA1_EUMVA|nr:hypothetical protein EVAR_60655_1 [Eumeta japonica]